MVILIDNSDSSGDSAILYRSNVSQNLSVNISSDFPNYADFTLDNFIIEIIPRSNNYRLFANSGDSAKGSINTKFYQAVVAYDATTGALTVTRPYGTYYSGSAYQGTQYFPYNVYIAPIIETLS